jgi:hypothetical protein
MSTSGLWTNSSSHKLKNFNKFAGHPTLKTGTIKHLKQPGPESNYLDWSWILDIHFCSTGVIYLLDPNKEKAAIGQAKVTFEQDNLAVCLVIAKTTHPANIRYVQQFNTNACKLWYALKAAHQDHSLGGMMYWLRKLTILRMSGDNIIAHLDKMGKIYKNLNSLVTPEHPLTTDNIFLVSILTSLPPDWLACVSSMMNEARVSLSCIINALKQEDLRQKAWVEDLVPVDSVSKTTAPSSNKPCPATSKYFCTFCKKNGHSLKQCDQAAAILAGHKPEGSSKSRGQGQRCSRCRGNRKPPAKAGQKTVVEIGGTVRDEESDYSGLDDKSYSCQAKAGNAVVTPSATALSLTDAPRERDINIDSGCLVTMTPYGNNVQSLFSDNTFSCFCHSQGCCPTTIWDGGKCSSSCGAGSP